jgi:hypothetical protein
LAVTSSFFRFSPARARVVLVAGAGASLGASEGEHIPDRVQHGGEDLPAGTLAFRGCRVGALISRALGPPGLWPIARVRRADGIATTTRDSRCVLVSIKSVAVTGRH